MHEVIITLTKKDHEKVWLAETSHVKPPLNCFGATVSIALRKMADVIDRMNDAQAKGEPLEDGRHAENSYQIGGQHYKTSIEHWDYVIANDIPYLEAQVIKYLTRWRKKNGFQDVAKAKHYFDKLIEIQMTKRHMFTPSLIPDCCYDCAKRKEEHIGEGDMGQDPRSTLTKK